MKETTLSELKSLKKDELDKIDYQTLEDFNYLDNKIINLIILTGGVLALFVQIADVSLDQYGLFLYLLIFIIFLCSLVLLIYAAHPTNYSSLNHNTILNYYQKDSQANLLLNDINKQKANSISKILRNIQFKVKLMSIALWLFFSGIILALCYKLIFSLGGK